MDMIVGRAAGTMTMMTVDNHLHAKTLFATSRGRMMPTSEETDRTTTAEHHADALRAMIGIVAIAATGIETINTAVGPGSTPIVTGKIETETKSATATANATVTGTIETASTEAIETELVARIMTDDETEIEIETAHDVQTREAAEPVEAWT